VPLPVCLVGEKTLKRSGPLSSFAPVPCGRPGPIVCVPDCHCIIAFMPVSVLKNSFVHLGVCMYTGAII
jgi:hypothetical protein